MWSRNNKYNTVQKFYIYAINEQIVNTFHDYVITEINSEQVYLKTVSGDHQTYPYALCSPNQYLRLKAMGGQWFVVSGSTYANI